MAPQAVQKAVQQAVAATLAPQGGLKSVLQQWAKRLLVMLVMWVVAGIVSAVLTGRCELPGWLVGRSEHERDVGVHELSNDTAPRLSEVGGMVSAKQELWYNLVVPLKNPSTFFGGKPCFQASRGILLFGPPGTGKTLLARAAARESGAAFIAPTLAQLEAKYYGETAKILQATFAVARRRSPSVVFFDEIDGMMRTRTSDEGCTYGLKTEMLRMLDSLKPEEAVVVVACTNSAAILDPALKRRLDVVVKVGLPTDAERADILRICAGEDVPSPSSLAAVVRLTGGFSGSDLHTVYRTACSLRLRRALGTQRDDVDGMLQSMPPLTATEWTAAVRRVRADKVASDAQSVGGIGSASDTLRGLIDGLKATSPPQPPLLPPEPVGPREPGASSDHDGESSDDGEEIPQPSS